MDLHSDLPFWTLKNGLMRAYPALDGDVRCDALVVGGGITGALVAHSLVKAGIDCIVIDRRDIGQGSTSASTALLQFEIDTPLHELAAIHGLAAAERAYEIGIEAIARLRTLAGSDCAFKSRSSLLVARRQTDIPKLRREFDLRHKARLPVGWLEGSDLKAEYGIPRPAAIHSSVAAECDPYRLTHRLLDRSRKRGLRVFDRTAAVSYTAHKSKVSVRTDRGCNVIARSIIFASGYENQTILPGNLVKLSSTYALVSEPFPDLSWWKERALIWETGESYLYSRTTSDDRILVGGGDDGVINGPSRDRQIPAKTKRLVTRFRTIYPECNLEPAFSWAGTFGSTKDGLAFIGRYSQFPLGYFALGFGGNGITYSVIAARIITNLFLGRKDVNARLFRFDR